MINVPLLLGITVFLCLILIVISIVMVRQNETRMQRDIEALHRANREYDDAFVAYHYSKHGSRNDYR